VLDDIGDPQLVRCWAIELALDQVSGGRHIRLAAETLARSW
jgi:hypothetical protein